VNAIYTVSMKTVSMKTLMRCYSCAKNHQVLKYHLVYFWLKTGITASQNLRTK